MFVKFSDNATKLFVSFVLQAFIAVGGMCRGIMVEKPNHRTTLCVSSATNFKELPSGRISWRSEELRATTTLTFSRFQGRILFRHP
jgi:hypothetical protein